ncbi:hypothetical protein SAMN05444695_11173 [Rhodococcus triatomae]|uniref:DUF1684 domain-containing protein n=1 Tax=Rhodococcus triatomae TaxID=300028 RepID=A0A1G8NI26_9NOCA|nr:hypothetical protein SAMN05444695_11173 [Rhodococcus triatomae]
MTTSPIDNLTLSDFESDWKKWHFEREEGLRDSVGWLSPTALHWLVDTDTTFGDLPGRWRADDDAVVVTATAADGLVRDGAPVDGELRIAAIEGAPGIELRHGERIVEVIRRTGDFALRVHDPEAQTLADFSGVPTFAPDPRWVFEARFVPFDDARTVTTGAVVEGLEHHHQALGRLEFRNEGVEHALIAFAGRSGALHVLFTDATSGVSTYPSARSLTVAVPADGTAVLDFNRAVNLPCAFTAYATCPVAPPENRLSFAVEAGEKVPS